MLKKLGNSMVRSDQKKGKPQVKKVKQDLADRLSNALRDNLRRRKAQARSRKSPDVDPDLANQPEKDGA